MFYPLIKINNPHSSKRILLVASFAEFWGMVSFFGIITILVLYTTKIFFFSDESSYTIYGMYLTIFCGLPIIGGIITDRLLGIFNSLILGSILIILGNICLLLQKQIFLFIGLATTSCGASLLKTTCANLVGKAYCNATTSEKEKAYSIFYAALNCGAIVGSSIFGIITYYLSWNYCFIFSMLGIFLSLIVFICHKSLFDQFCPESSHCSLFKVIFAYIILTLISIIVTFIFYNYSLFNKMMLLFILGVSLVFYFFIKKQSQFEKKKMFGILILLSFSVLFFTASLQVGSSITLFIDRFVNRMVFNWQIPTPFFTALNPFFLVLTAPFFTYLWKKLSLKKKEPTTVVKLAFGLFIASMGFICFWFAALISANYKNITLVMLLLGYLFIGAGEICLSPAILCSIHRYSPHHIENTMMGSWYFFMAIAGYFSGFCDQLITKINAPGLESQLLNFEYIFSVIIIITITSGCILLINKRSINGLFE